MRPLPRTLLDPLAAAVLTMGVLTVTTSPAAAADWFPGSVQEFIQATPALVTMDETITRLAGGNFIAVQTDGMEGYVDVRRKLFQQRGVTRISARDYHKKSITITYTSATRHCTRKVTRAQPNTFTADAKATWTCRAARPSDITGKDFATHYAPVHYLTTHEWSKVGDYTGLYGASTLHVIGVSPDYNMKTDLDYHPVAGDQWGISITQTTGADLENLIVIAPITTKLPDMDAFHQAR